MNSSFPKSEHASATGAAARGVALIWLFIYLRRLDTRSALRTKPDLLYPVRSTFIKMVGLGAAIPRLELFMELVGAVCLSVMGLLLPSLLELVWRWDKDLTRYHWVVWKNVGISVFSVVALVSGVAYAIIAMIEKL